jgi:hypothetical protein
MVQHYPDDTRVEPTEVEDTRPLHRADARDSGPAEVAPERRHLAGEVDPEYRGFKGGAAFFGWLVAIGLIALLTGIVSAIAAAVGYAITIDWNTAKADAGTIGIASGAVLLLILAIAYYNGGYVAGRLARFDGARQGFGVWLIGVVVTAVVAGIAALAGSQYDIFNRVELPSLPISTDTLTTGGVVAIAAAVVITLIAAVIGGKRGQWYHRRIDKSSI